MCAAGDQRRHPRGVPLPSGDRRGLAHTPAHRRAARRVPEHCGTRRSTGCALNDAPRATHPHGRGSARRDGRLRDDRCVGGGAQRGTDRGRGRGVRCHRPRATNLRPSHADVGQRASAAGRSRSGARCDRVGLGAVAGGDGARSRRPDRPRGMAQPVPVGRWFGRHRRDDPHADSVIGAADVAVARHLCRAAPRRW